MDTDLPLQRAKERLTIWDVWDATALERPPYDKWGRKGLVSSPFRNDSDASFSVDRDGAKFFDFGEQRGGDVITFIERAFDMDFRDARAKALELAGVEDDPRRASEMSKAERRRRAVAQRNKQSRAAFERMKAMYEETAEAPQRALWSPVVFGRWSEGRLHVRTNKPKLRQLAEMRGWPLEWAYGLCNDGLVSLPVKAGFEIEPGAPRGWAFAVESPGEDGEMVTVGYHQYTPFRDRNTGKTRKVWGYFPNATEKKRPSTYQNALMREGRTVPALPFCIGETRDPERVCILEGQWDAITYFGAIGGFDIETPRVLVLGCRGVSSQELVLSDWGRVLRGREVVLVPQSDEAGLAWVRRERKGLGVEVPCFADRLGELASKLTVKELPEGMDYNDFYRTQNIQNLNG